MLVMRRAVRVDMAAIIKEIGQLAQNRRIAGHRLQRLFGKGDQRTGIEAGRQPLEPHRRNLPIAIAARPPQQVDLARKAVDKGLPQFKKQRCIIARCSRNRLIYVSK